MKKFETFMIVVAVIFIGIMTIGMISGSFSQKEIQLREQKELQEENRLLLHQKHINNVLFGKYADSISDEMLHDFYPDATNLDSLRYQLKDTYESHMAAEEDGLI